jgi:hypothetical protein
MDTKMEKKDKPIIVFFTSKKCGICENFRGEDGRPSLTKSKKWNNDLIKTLLINKKNPKTLQVSKIIEIHNYLIGNKIENILEFNIYVLINSKLNIDETLITTLLSDENNVVGDEILRISISRGHNNELLFSSEINGNSEDFRCNLINFYVKKFFLYNYLPKYLIDCKDHFLNHEDGFDKLYTPEFKKDKVLYDIINKNYYDFKSDPLLFEDLLRNIYNYSWFLANFFPKRIRELETFYPTWMLILPSEWSKGLMGDKVFCKIKGCKLVLSDGNFVSQNTNPENIEDLIDQYYDGKLSLTYSEVNEPLNIDKSKKVTFRLST